MKEKTKNGAKNKELEKKLLVGLGFNLGFVSKFSFFLFPALAPRTPGGEGQVNRKCFLSYWPFLYKGRIIRLDELGQTFCCSSGLCISSIKTGTRRTVMLPDELSFVVRRSRRISKESSSRRIMRLVPVFILETHNQTNY